MSVVNILEVTNPVYENHMIVPAAVDSSSTCYWLPFPLNAQGELHHFALVFLQLILECHFSLRSPCVLHYLLIHSLSLFLQSRIISQYPLDGSLSPLMETELFAPLCLYPVIEPREPHQDLAMRRVAVKSIVLVLSLQRSVGGCRMQVR